MDESGKLTGASQEKSRPCPWLYFASGEKLAQTGDMVQRRMERFAQLLKAPTTSPCAVPDLAKLRIHEGGLEGTAGDRGRPAPPDPAWTDG